MCFCHFQRIILQFMEMHIVLTFTHIVTFKLLELLGNATAKSQKDYLVFSSLFLLMHK